MQRVRKKNCIWLLLINLFEYPELDDELLNNGYFTQLQERAGRHKHLQVNDSAVIFVHANDVFSGMIRFLCRVIEVDIQEDGKPHTKLKFVKRLPDMSYARMWEKGWIQWHRFHFNELSKLKIEQRIEQRH